MNANVLTIVKTLGRTDLQFEGSRLKVKQVSRYRSHLRYSNDRQRTGGRGSDRLRWRSRRDEQEYVQNLNREDRSLSHIKDLAGHRMIGNITKKTRVDVLIGAMLDSRTVGTMKGGGD